MSHSMKVSTLLKIVPVIEAAAMVLDFAKQPIDVEGHFSTIFILKYAAD